MIRITSKKEGFRRCGVAHPATLVEHADDVFTPEQIERLKTEPMLMVELVDYSQPSQAQKPLNVDQSVELVKAAQTIEELDKLGENESRNGVIKAIAKRRAELAPAE